jgi:vitamin B12 transporter|tara:strand:- start:3901 stop:5724 length:1824 start_codon:yes stop_codon:yes gene_type:complete
MLFIWIFFLLFNSIILQAQVIDDTSKPDEIIVKSTRSNSNVYQLGSSVEIISAEEIKKNSFNFVSEALQTSSGVYVSQTGSFGGTATVRIRGASSDQTLVLIDGVPISDPSSPGGGYDFSSLLTSNIDRIEILKGSQSTLWGSDAIGGVINIVTFENASIPNIHLNTEIGSFNTEKIGTDFNIANEHNSLFLSYDSYKSDGISKADKRDGNSEKDGIGSRSYLLKTNHNIFNSEISSNINYRESDVDYDGYGFATGVTDSDENTKGRQLNWSLLLRKAFLDDQLVNSILFGESEIDRKYYTNNIENFSAKGERKFIRYVGNYSLNDNNSFTFGFENEEVTTSGVDFDTRSIFLLYETLISKNFGFSLGLRGDDRNNLASQETPKITAFYNLNDEWRLRANWGEGFKLPTIFQSTFFCCGAEKPNENLLPETSEGYEIGIDYKSNENFNKIGVTFFDQDISNMIDFSFSIGGYENIKKVYSKGVEVNFVSQLKDNITISGSFTKLDSENEFGSRLSRLPEEKGNLNIDFSLGLKNNFYISLFYNGDEVDPRGEVSDWFRSDLNFSRNISDKAKIYFKVKNIFDEEYQDIYGYGTEERSFSIGINLSAG